MRTPAAAFLDACCVLAFVAIGRASHDHGESAAGLASTAWPFLTGLAAGWLVTRAWRRPSAIVPGGMGAWLGAVAVGMVLRVAAGQGTAPAFIGVALAFLGLFLLGWRAAIAACPAEPPPSPAPDRAHVGWPAAPIAVSSKLARLRICDRGGYGLRFAVVRAGGRLLAETGFRSGPARVPGRP